MVSAFDGFGNTYIIYKPVCIYVCRTVTKVQTSTSTEKYKQAVTNTKVKAPNAQLTAPISQKVLYTFLSHVPLLVVDNARVIYDNSKWNERMVHQISPNPFQLHLLINL
jgi:hypothetical protein